MTNIFGASIWSKHSIPASEWKYRNSKRLMLPFIDFLFVLAGISAAIFGVPSISEFFPNSTVDFFAIFLSLSALAALIGVCFPKLWWLEISGKISLLGLMSAFSTSLLFITTAGEDTKGFTFFISLIALSPIIWRLTILGTEWQERRNSLGDDS